MQRFLQIILAVFLLSGCAMFSKETEDFSCPKTGFIAGADSVFFRETGVEAVMNGFTAECSFKKAAGVQVDLTIPFIVNGEAPPSGSPASREISYFIAVLSPENVILQKQKFFISIPFDDKGVKSETEEHTVMIPKVSMAEAGRYKIVAGFVLTPEQLKHNEEKK